MTERGIIIPTLSFLVRTSLEHFEKILINGGAHPVTHIWDAGEILEKLGLTNLNPSGRGARNHMEELQRAEYDFEGYDMSELEVKRTKKDMDKVDDELIGAAAEVMRDQGLSEEDIQARVAAAKTAKHEERDKAEKDALASSGAVPLAHDNEWPDDDASDAGETENDTEQK